MEVWVERVAVAVFGDVVRVEEGGVVAVDGLTELCFVEGGVQSVPIP